MQTCEVCGRDTGSDDDRLCAMCSAAVETDDDPQASEAEALLTSVLRSARAGTVTAVDGQSDAAAEAPEARTADPTEFARELPQRRSTVGQRRGASAREPIVLRELAESQDDTATDDGQVHRSSATVAASLLEAFTSPPVDDPDGGNNGQAADESGTADRQDTTQNVDAGRSNDSAQAAHDDDVASEPSDPLDNVADADTADDDKDTAETVDTAKTAELDAAPADADSRHDLDAASHPHESNDTGENALTSVEAQARDEHQKSDEADRDNQADDESRATGAEAITGRFANLRTVPMDDTAEPRPASDTAGASPASSAPNRSQGPARARSERPQRAGAASRSPSMPVAAGSDTAKNGTLGRDAHASDADASHDAGSGVEHTARSDEQAPPTSDSAWTTAAQIALLFIGVLALCEIVVLGMVFASLAGAETTGSGTADVLAAHDKVVTVLLPALVGGALTAGTFAVWRAVTTGGRAGQTYVAGLPPAVWGVIVGAIALVAVIVLDSSATIDDAQTMTGWAIVASVLLATACLLAPRALSVSDDATTAESTDGTSGADASGPTSARNRGEGESDAAGQRRDSDGGTDDADVASPTGERTPSGL